MLVNCLTLFHSKSSRGKENMFYFNFPIIRGCLHTNSWIVLSFSPLYKTRSLKIYSIVAKLCDRFNTCAALAQQGWLHCGIHYPSRRLSNQTGLCAWRQFINSVAHKKTQRLIGRHGFNTLWIKLTLAPGEWSRGGRYLGYPCQCAGACVHV